MNGSSLFAYSHKLKFLGMLLILWGSYLFASKYWQHHLLDLNLLSSLSCWGLIFIFFSKEKIDDERVHQIKFQALTWAVPSGLAITQLVNYFILDKARYNSGKILESISAYQSLVVILLLAFGLFHFLKYKN
jgi:hypothetical protein